MRLAFSFLCVGITLLSSCGLSGPVSPTASPPTQTVTAPTRASASATATPSPSPSASPAPSTTPSLTPKPAAAYVFPVATSAVTYGKDHHDYPATDIFCDIGSPFVAVTDGVVDAIVAVDTWDPATDVPADRSGLAVAIIGTDGVRYYGSHLSAIRTGLAVGQTVSAGDVLGLTGASGNARFTPPHLHFGISQPSTPDDWQARRGQLSPYPFLRAWQNGESMTPTFEQ